MSFKRVSSGSVAWMVILSIASVAVAGTPVVHYNEDYTDGSATNNSGIMLESSGFTHPAGDPNIYDPPFEEDPNTPPTRGGFYAIPTIQQQSSWRNSSQTYLGVGIAFNSQLSPNGAQNEAFKVPVNATLDAGNVWVYSVSMISDVAHSASGYSLFGATGVSIEESSFTGPIMKLSSTTSENTSSARQLIGDTNAGWAGVGDATAPFNEIAPLPTTLTDASMPTALNAVVNATWVYQPTPTNKTRVSAQTINGSAAADDTATFKTMIPDVVAQIHNPNLAAPTVKTVTFSQGSGGGQNVAFTTFDNNPPILQLGLTHLTFKQVQNTDFNTDNVTNAAGDGTILAANVGTTNKSFFDGDVNGDGNVDATSDGFKLLQTIGGASGTASAKLNSATGQVSLTTNNVGFVELISTGNNLVPGNAVPLGSITNAVFQDSPSTGKINFAGWSALGSGGTLTNFSLGAVLPTGFTNVADLQLRYLNGSTEVFVGVTLASSVPGDFDADGDVDGADFVAWQTNFPKPGGALLSEGDADGDGDVDGADFVVWQTNFPYTPGPAISSVPEPTSFLLSSAALCAVGIVAFRTRATLYSVGAL